MSLAEVPSDFGPTVVSLGNFDGMHKGHRWALSNLVEHARQRGAKSVAITFDPHPLHVLRPDHAPPLISDLDSKLEQMTGTGLDAALVIEFTRDFAALSPREFVEQVLLDGLGARAVVVGHDIRFGHRNSGDVETMRELGRELGIEVILTDDLTGEDGTEDRRWSSSWIRELLTDGEVEAAADALGRLHRVVGEVVHGDHRGRELGFPTANLSRTSVGMIPADGVYAGWLIRLDAAAERLPAAISVGTNPTFEGERRRRVEAYVLDRTDLDLYGERVAVEFARRLRPTLVFSGVDELITQMNRDVEDCRRILL